jgi:glycosyltransferase involved in cell wall biosynthesis
MPDHLTTGKILVDLKPAFDGFGGIPAETRLLFRGLRQLPGWDAKGLLQHGSRRLRGGLDRERDASLDVPAQLFKLSKLLISVDGSHTDWVDAARDGFGRYFAAELLRLRTMLGLPVRTSLFRARHFPDFMWRTLFDKTLGPRDKHSLTSDDYHVLSPSRKSFQSFSLRGTPTATPRFPCVDTRGFDFFVAQTPFPGRVSPGTRLVVRYHDAVPILMPHTIKDKAFHQATHYQSLRSNVRSGAKFVCISDATRTDLLTVFPEIESRVRVIHDMLSDEYYEDDAPASLVPHIVRNRTAESKEAGFRPPASQDTPPGFEYLLMVSTLEPRKNHALLLSAWERLKYLTHPHLKLVVVGNVGWGATGILRSFKPWIDRGELFHLQNVPSEELRILYRHASATVCPSVAEGFDYSGAEAMRCACPVASSDISVHREVYQDASVYFNPYSPDDAASVMRNLLAPEAAGQRRHLIERGRAVSQKYLSGNIIPHWLDYFRSEMPVGRQIS